MTADSHIFPVVLAGGVGARFWPASTPARPKQLLSLGTSRPLIVEAVDRASGLAGPDRVRVLCGIHLVDPFRGALPELDDDHFMVEPAARGTGTVLAWTATELVREDPEAVMVSLHADHVISPPDAFRATVMRAAAAATDRHTLVCIGVPPDRPETGYGYIRRGPEVADGVFAVERFVEKPDLSTASEYVDSGEYLWNSGIFVWRAADLLAAIHLHTPELSDHLERLQAGDVAGFFQAVTPVSVDVGVLERAANVDVVQATFDWDDVGTWNALARTVSGDSAGNVSVGLTRCVDASGNIVWAEEGRVTLYGVDDLVVVRSGDETLITTRAAAPDLKRLMTHLEAEDET